MPNSVCIVLTFILKNYFSKSKQKNDKSEVMKLNI